MPTIISHTSQAVQFTEKAENLLSVLYTRWQDEKEYEHIDAYMQSFSKLAEECGVMIRRMLKKPFGMEFAVKVEPTATDPKTERLFRFTCTGRSIGWKRIA